MAVDAPPKKPLSERQRAHLDRLHGEAEARRQEQHARPVDDTQVAPPSSRETFLARQRHLRSHSIEDIDDVQGLDEPGLPYAVSGQAGGTGGGTAATNRPPPSPAKRSHGMAGAITVEHETDRKVKLWKRGPYGWGPRLVPSHSLEMNLANGWMEYCPDCGGTDCGADPNTCSAKRGRQYITCPVVQANGTPCGKRIFATGIARSTTREPGEFELVGVYDKISVQDELRGKMDRHIMHYHHDEAQTLGLFNQNPAAPRLGIDSLEEEPPTP